MTHGPVTFRIDEQSHFALWKLIFLRSLAKCFYWMVPLAVLLGLLFAESMTVFEVGLPILAGLVGGGAILGIQWLTLHIRANRVFRESALLHEEMAISGDDQCFGIEQASGDVRLNWSQVAKWDESEELLVIFPNRLMGYLLPKDRIPSAFIDFCRGRLIDSGLPRPGKLRK